MIKEQQVKEALKNVKEPKLGKNLLDIGMIKNLSLASGNVTLTLALPTLKYPL